MAPYTEKQKRLADLSSRMGDIAATLRTREIDRLAQQVIQHGPQVLDTPTRLDVLMPQVSKQLKDTSDILAAQMARKVGAAEQSNSHDRSENSKHNGQDDEDDSRLSPLDSEQQRFVNVFGPSGEATDRGGPKFGIAQGDQKGSRGEVAAVQDASDEIIENTEILASDESLLGAKGYRTRSFVNANGAPITSTGAPLPQTRAANAPSLPLASTFPQSAARDFDRSLTSDELLFARNKASLTDDEIILLKSAWQHIEELQGEPVRVNTFPWWFDVLYRFGGALLREYDDNIYRSFVDDPGEVLEKNRVLDYLKLGKGEDSLLKLRSVGTKDDDEGYNEKDAEADAKDGD